MTQTGYVIRRLSDGKFVARSGSAHSYTVCLQDAAIYKTLAAAKHDRCPDNEIIYTVDECLYGLGR